MLSTRFVVVFLFACIAISGCVLHSPDTGKGHGQASVANNRPSRQGHCIYDYDLLNEPVSPACYQPNPDAIGGLGPRSIDEMPTDFWDLTLDEAVHIAVQNSEVIRDLGGRVLDSPANVQTKYNPAIEYTDPFFGVEAALSAFDATLSNQFSYQNNDRVFNNTTLGGGATELAQDLSVMQTQLSKLAATGTQMSLRSATSHDRNNRAGNLFGHLWESQFEAEVRQPLLQGAGLGFNRIAGPNASPGFRFSNGVVIAQMNSDISKVDFEIGVRTLVGDVVDSYWQLFRAYHDFDSKQATRIAAKDTWKAVQAKFEQDLAGGEADKEAQARAQFYYYQDLSIEALNGSLGSIGVYEAERQLRLLLGLPVNDGRMLRPIEEVSEARILYDWQTLSCQAAQRRAEIRKQQWVVKQEELKLVAAKNFVLPRLDATALYRMRGFGDDLVGDGDGGRFASAGKDLTSLDHQEWEFGLQFNVPIGRRRALAGVRHAELRLSRERGILREQQFQVSHELANAIGRDEQTHASMIASRERFLAAIERLEATEASFDADKVSLDMLLEAQERLGAAQSRYYELVSSHAIAEKNVQLAGGALLSSFGIRLQGDCPMIYSSQPSKHRDKIDYRYQVPCPTSSGQHPQQVDANVATQTPVAFSQSSNAATTTTANTTNTIRPPVQTTWAPTTAANTVSTSTTLHQATMSRVPPVPFEQDQQNVAILQPSIQSLNQSPRLNQSHTLTQSQQFPPQTTPSYPQYDPTDSQVITELAEIPEVTKLSELSEYRAMIAPEPNDSYTPQQARQIHALPPAPATVR